MLLIFHRIVCIFVGHKGVRRRVWSDGSRLRCHCDRCGIALARPLDGDWTTLARAERGNR